MQQSHERTFQIWATNCLNQTLSTPKKNNIHNVLKEWYNGTQCCRRQLGWITFLRIADIAMNVRRDTMIWWWMWWEKNYDSREFWEVPGQSGMVVRNLSRAVLNWEIERCSSRRWGGKELYSLGPVQKILDSLACLTHSGASFGGSIGVRRVLVLGL